MKKQQLFNSFWLASTTVVLVVQTVWADGVISNNTSLPVFNSSYGLDFSANVTKAKLNFLNGGNASRFSNSTNGFTGATITPLNGDRVTAQQPLPERLSANRVTAQQPLPERTPGSGKPAPDTRNEAVPPTNEDRSQKPQIPDYLNPDPNSLQFPTTTEEIRLRGTQPITLQQAYELARRNNRELQVAELTLERSRALLRQALAAEYPNLTVRAALANEGSDVFSNRVSRGTSVGQGIGTTGQTTGTTGQTTDPVTGQTTGTTGQTTDPVTGQTTGTTGQTTQIQQGGGGVSLSSTGLSGTVSLSYDLYTSGERRASIRSAEEQLRFDQLDVERAAEDLRLNVSNDYYDLQLADESVRISQAAVANAQASLRDAQALEQAGVGTRFDVLRSQVELANETQNLTNALRQQQVERRALAQRLSLSQSVNVSAADPVEIAGLWNLALEDSIVLAFQNRAELEQQLALRNQSEQRRRIALSTIGPLVSLIASYSPSDTLNDNEIFNDGYSVGANVSLLLFDGGEARARAASERANIAIAEANFANQRNLIRFGVEEAYANLQSNFSNIQTASVALEQAREALRLARLRFQAGVGTQTDVIAAQDDLTEAEGDRVTAILDYNRSLATLQRSISSGQPR